MREMYAEILFKIKILYNAFKKKSYIQVKAPTKYFTVSFVIKQLKTIKKKRGNKMILSKEIN